jgi:ABC-2 type transport system permease protein
MRLYYETARKTFQRSSTYRLATLTGIVVNSFFGYITCQVFLALYSSVQTEKIANFGLTNTLSYTWYTQAMISTVQVWFDKEISKTIVTGDIVSDFAKPFDYQTFWLSRFVGTSFFSFLFRSIPTYVVGMLFFGAQLPKNLVTVPLFLTSLSLSIGVSFLIGYMVNLTSFWTISSAGSFTIMSTVQMFFSGFVVPIAYMPDWLIGLSNLLPFRAIISIPAQIWLEQQTGWEILLPQVGWLVLLWLLARQITNLARRKVTIQGG